MRKTIILQRLTVVFGVLFLVFNPFAFAQNAAAADAVLQGYHRPPQPIPDLLDARPLLWLKQAQPEITSLS